MTEVLEALILITGSLATIVVTIVGLLHQMRESDALDLKKTLEAFDTVKGEVIKMSGPLDTLKDAGDRGVNLIESYRGKKLKPKLANKVRVKVRALLENDE